MSTIATLRTVFTADTGGFTSALGSMGKSLDGLQGTVGKAKGAITGSGGWEGSLKVAAAASAAAGVALFKLGGDFQQSYNTIRRETGATGQSLEGLKQSMRNVMATRPEGMEQVTQAIVEVNRASGATGPTLENVARTSLRLASVSKEDLGPQLKSTQQMFNNWGIAAEDQVPKLDTLWRVHQTTGISVTQLSDTMAKQGPVLRQLGLSYEESASLLGTLEKNGIPATQMQAGFNRVIAEGAKQNRPAADVLRDYAGRIKNAASESEAAGIAVQIFGQRSGPRLAALIREGKISFDDLTKGIADGSDTIAKSAEASATPWGRMRTIFNQVRVALEPIAVTLFNQVKQAIDFLMPVVRTLTGLLGDFLGALGPAPQIIGAVVLALFALHTHPVLTTLGLIAVAVTKLKDTMGPIVYVIGGVAAAFTLLKGGMVESVWQSAIGLWDKIKGGLAGVGDMARNAASTISGLAGRASEAVAGGMGQLSGTAGQAAGGLGDVAQKAAGGAEQLSLFGPKAAESTEQLSLFGTKAGEAAQGASGAGEAAAGAGGGMLGMAGGILGAAGAAVGLGFAVYQVADQLGLFETSADRAREAGENWARSFVEAVPGELPVKMDIVRAELDRTNEHVGFLDEKLGMFGPNVSRVAALSGESLRSLADSGTGDMARLAQSLINDGFDPAMGLGHAYNQLKGRSGELSGALGEMEGKWAAQRAAMQRQNEMSGLAQGYTGDTAAKFGELKTRVDEATKALEGAAGEMDKWISKGMTAQQNAVGTASSINSFSESLKTNGATLDLNSKQGIANQQAMLGVENQIKTNVVSMAKEGKSIEDIKAATAAHTGQLYRTAEQYGLSRAQVEKYIDQANLTPEKIETFLEDNDSYKKAADDAREAKDEMEKLPKSGETNWRFKMKTELEGPPPPAPPGGEAGFVLPGPKARGAYYGAILGLQRGGFKTDEPVLIGEDGSGFPEYVIPTNPAHRANALRLAAELMTKLHEPAAVPVIEEVEEEMTGLQAGGVLGGAAAGGAPFIVPEELLRRVIREEVALGGLAAPGIEPTAAAGMPEPTAAVAPEVAPEPAGLEAFAATAVDSFGVATTATAEYDALFGEFAVAAAQRWGGINVTTQEQTAEMSAAVAATFGELGAYLDAVTLMTALGIQASWDGLSAGLQMTTLLTAFDIQQTMDGLSLGLQATFFAAAAGMNATWQGMAEALTARTFELAAVTEARLTAMADQVMATMNLLGAQWSAMWDALLTTLNVRYDEFSNAVEQQTKWLSDAVTQHFTYMAGEVDATATDMLARFEATMDAMARAGDEGGRRTADNLWGKLNDKVGPIEEVVREFARKMVGALNPILEGVGEGTITLGFARGGTVPGSPGGGDSVPALLEPGEYVMPLNAVRRLGVGMLDSLRKGYTLPGAGKSGRLIEPRPYQEGGVVTVAQAIMGATPGLTQTSGFRPGDPGYHGRGLAIDLGGSVGAMNAGSAFINSSGLWQQLTEGIYAGAPHLSVKNNAQVPPGFWGGGTWAGHADHIHIAVDGDAKAMIGRVSLEKIDRERLKELGGEWMGETTAKLADYVTDLAQKWVDANTFSLGPGGPIPPGEVQDWINEALQILGMEGDAAWRQAIYNRAMVESGGNPHAINNWDSNAAKGTPSKGLIQTIDPTFQAHALPGYGDIWNPVHNIIAGVRYAQARYGAGALARMGNTAPGSNYAGGGIVTRTPGGRNITAGEGGRDEAVIPLPSGWRGMAAGMGRGESLSPAGGQRSGPAVNIEHYEVRENADHRRIFAMAAFEERAGRI